MGKLLRGKTDAECRDLAGHYLARAKRAERENENLRKENAQLLAENRRLVGLAQEMVEAIDG